MGLNRPAQGGHLIATLDLVPRIGSSRTCGGQLRLNREPNQETVMDQDIQDALNRQINKELFASYLYLSMCAHFESKSLQGFAQWMRAQAREELVHAMRIFDHLNDRGATVRLAALDEPAREFGTPTEAFEEALKHEKAVTEMIHQLYDMAAQKHDHAAQLLMEWFITEQVEEEANVGTVVDRLRMAGDNQAAILMLDRELGARQQEGT